MNKLIVTEWRGMRLSAFSSNDRIVQLSLDEKEDTSILNHIYIGKVKNIVKNIGAAFVEFGDGQIGYYSLIENRHHLFTDTERGDSAPSSCSLKPGDELIVQVSKDPVKTKAPVLTSKLTFTGRYCVLTAGKRMIGFSGKISDSQWKNNLKPELEGILWKDESHPFLELGVIIRTNAYEVPESALMEELLRLKAQCMHLLSEARYRTCGSRLDENLPSYVAALRDSYAGEAEEIVTDDKRVWEDLKSYIEKNGQETMFHLRFYDDPLLPLSKLYNLDGVMEKALASRVWLKSGGYLVIEPTEALTVIDVNTGKYTGKKTPSETIFKINMEAAAEICLQLRLRNLSGIIIVDFIDMETEEQKAQLMKYLRELCYKDHVKTVVVDMTELNLVEMTRKKVKKPLLEQARGARREAAL